MGDLVFELGLHLPWWQWFSKQGPRPPKNLVEMQIIWPHSDLLTQKPSGWAPGCLNQPSGRARLWELYSTTFPSQRESLFFCLLVISAKWMQAAHISPTTQRNTSLLGAKCRARHHRDTQEGELPAYRVQSLIIKPDKHVHEVQQHRTH